MTGINSTPSRRVDFARVNRVAMSQALAIVSALVPDGRREAHEWVARNPKRCDRRPGSFKINLNTGMWADFATGDRGGDLVSFAAFVTGLTQREAALHLAECLNLNPYQS